MERPCFALFKRKRLKPIAYAGVIKSLLAMPMARPWSRSIGDIPIGQDPIETAALWHKATRVPFWPRRRGLASPPTRHWAASAGTGRGGIAHRRRKGVP